MARKYNSSSMFETHDGHKLSAREIKWINAYMETGNVADACRQANVKTNYLKKDYIVDEIKWRMAQLEDESIANTEEVMMYFTKVMRGELKDQFGLDAPLSERTSAAKELAKRIIDNVQGKESKDSTVNIVLDWKRD